jgi:hypothetical protein
MCKTKKDYKDKTSKYQMHPFVKTNGMAIVKV